MGDGHPTYPNPTIVEALCEVHFRPLGGWRGSLFGEFFKRVQNQYPEMEPVSEIGLQLEHGPNGIAQRILLPRRMRFKHSERGLELQLGENVLTVNVLAPYPGWERMRRDVSDVWCQASEVLEPVAITRIGLRYINRIPLATHDERLQGWVSPGDHIPPSVLDSGPGVLLKVQTTLDAANRLIVTLTDPASEAGNADRGIVLDIDRIVEREVSPATDALEAEMSRLHDDVWEVFASAKGQQLEKLLQGGA